MKTNQRTSLVLALVSLLTGSALVAGTVGGAVNTTVGATTHAAASVAGQVSVPGVPGLSGGHIGATATMTGGATTATGTGTTSASGSLLVNGNTVSPDSSLGVALQAAGTDHDTIGMREARLQVRADALASEEVKASSQIDYAIGETAYADREKIDADIRKNLDETKDRIAKDDARVSAQARSDFDAAKAEVSAREIALTDSLKAAASATKDSWESARADVAVNYSLYASAAMRTGVIAASGSASASGALNSGPTIAAIRASDVSARDQIASDLSAKLSASKQAMASTETEAKALTGNAKENYVATARLVDHRERELKHSLASAKKATGSDWEHARTDVATAYANYTEAVTRAELAASARESDSVVAKSSSVQTASNGALVANEHN